MDWLSWVILGVIAVLFVAVIVCEIRNRKKGKKTCSCGGSCGGCAMNGACHGNHKNS